MRKTIGAITALLALGGAGTALADRGDQLTELARNRALWKSLHLRDYSYRLAISCFCPAEVRGPVTIVVRNRRPSGGSVFQKDFDTVPELFAAISHALHDDKAGDVAARYNRRRGFPRFASIDRIKLAIDDEVSFTVDRFRALRRR